MGLKKDNLFYARIIQKKGIYEVCEITVRTVGDTWFTAINKKDKRIYLFLYTDIGKNIFYNKKQALSKVLVAKNRNSNLYEAIDENRE